jgi:hypothetical protein
MHLDINVTTWFKARAKFRHGAANSLCDPSDTSMIFGKQSDDAIGFAQFLRAQDDGLIAIER